MRQSARVLGLKTPIPGGQTLQDLAKEMIALSRQGLKNRAKYSVSGDDETGFVMELQEIADSGVTPAERLLERYHGAWDRDVRPVFDEMAY